jgi:hypothetical protein
MQLKGNFKQKAATGPTFFSLNCFKATPGTNVWFENDKEKLTFA